MGRRSYSGGAVETTLTAGINAAATSATIASATGWPDGSGGDFYIVIDPDTASEEKILVDARSGTTLNGLVRGVDGTSDASHSSGAVVKHVFTATDADEANAHVNTAHLSPTLIDAKGDLIVGNGPDNPVRFQVGADYTTLRAQSSALRGVVWSSIGSGVATDAAETTSSTSYTDLATVGPAVSMLTGPNALVIISAWVAVNAAAGNAYMSVELGPFGVTTIPASDSRSILQVSAGSGIYASKSSAFLISGLTPGSNVFTAKYKSGGAYSVEFRYRNLTVIPL